jgi:transposase
MRVATLFKRLLRLGRERVVGVELREDGQEQVIVDIARPAGRRMRCPGCGFQTRATYDRAIRTWRHLDALRTRCLLRCEVRRIDCPRCGVVGEQVPWARPGSRFTRAFEDTCAFLARAAPKSAVAELMRVDWATVGRMVERVVDEALEGAGEEWLSGLRLIGVDEVSFRKGHRYLICVTDHETGRIVWAHPGRSPAVLELFFLLLGPERCARIEAVSVDLYGGWPQAIRRHARRAAICADPFHVVALVTDALDTLRRQDWQRLRKDDPERARWFKGTRFLLRRRAEDLAGEQRTILEELAERNRAVYEGWLLVDQLRAVYRAPDPDQAALVLEAWCQAAETSGHQPFHKAAATIRRHAAAIVNAIRLGINNARLEGLNSTVRLISHRSRGFRRVESLIALIHLVCGKVSLTLPT